MSAMIGFTPDACLGVQSSFSLPTHSPSMPFEEPESILFNPIKVYQDISMKWLKAFPDGQRKLALAHLEKNGSGMFFL